MNRISSPSLAAAALAVCLTGVAQAADKPNIIYILADDLGYGDLGCYGQKIVKTPHLDRLAKEGLRFTQHYSGSTVCAPTRSSLMTGQHTGHTSCRGNTGGSAQHLDKDDVTIGHVMQKAGYVTGQIGKWGLGLEDSGTTPNEMGFDFFYGHLSQIVAHSYYPPHMWRNQKKELLPGNNNLSKKVYSHDLMAKEAVAFIEKNKDKPFFLYVPFEIPHAGLDVPEDSMKPYLDLPKGKTYGKQGQKWGYTYQEQTHAAFAGMVSRMDRDIGRIMAKVADLGLDDNTLIMFSSDNGPHVEGGADPKFFNSGGGLTGTKRSLTEGGIRAPMIARWPGKIKPRSVTHHISAHWDLLPTCAEIGGGKSPDKIDGISFLPTLLGKDGQAEHKYLYWEFLERGGKQAIRKGNWKAIRLDVGNNEDAPIHLYNLATDLKEQNDIAKDHPEVVEEMAALFKEAHVEGGDDYKLFPSEKKNRKKKSSKPAREKKVAPKGKKAA